jgi:hypothetical protein
MFFIIIIVVTMNWGIGGSFDSTISRTWNRGLLTNEIKYPHNNRA